MKNKITKTDLKNVLKAVRIVDYKYSLPILKTVKFDTDDTATVTNGLAAVQIKLLEGSIDTPFLMNYEDIKRFEKICDKKSFVEVTKNLNGDIIYTDFITQICDKGISNLPLTDFPNFDYAFKADKNPDIIVNSLAFQTASLFVGDKHEIRMSLRGIHIDGENIVGCNGKTLYMYKYIYNTVSKVNEFQKTLNIEDNWIKLLNEDSSVEFTEIDDKRFIVRNGVYTICSVFIQDKYPIYRQVVPMINSLDKTVKIDVENILNYWKIQSKEQYNKGCNLSCYIADLENNTLKIIDKADINDSNINNCFAFQDSFFKPIVESGFCYMHYSSNKSTVILSKDTKPLYQTIVFMPVYIDGVMAK